MEVEMEADIKVGIGDNRCWMNPYQQHTCTVGMNRDAQPCQQLGAI